MWFSELAIRRRLCGSWRHPRSQARTALAGVEAQTPTQFVTPRSMGATGRRLRLCRPAFPPCKTEAQPEEATRTGDLERLSVFPDHGPIRTATGWTESASTIMPMERQEACW